MSIYEGISDLHHSGKIERAAWNYVVLGFAAIFEIVTVIVAARDFRRERGSRGWWVGVHTSKDPTVFTVLLDNGAAVIGLVIAFVGIFLEHVFQLAYLDGIASILIGLTLAAVAVVLAVESKGLLIGEASINRLSNTSGGSPKAIRQSFARAAHLRCTSART